jgi:GNAT superfamily N-acetyltransferase
MAGSDPNPVFSDADLARRLESAEGNAAARFVEARARVRPESGARWIEVDGARAIYDGVDSPVTQTFGLGMRQPATAAALETIEAFFGERGAPVSHEVSPLAGVELAALLSERGYRPIEFTSVMYRPVAGGVASAGSRNDRIRVRVIGDGEGELWARTTAKGWSEYPELADFLIGMGRVIAEREDSISLLAELDGQPIASGVLCPHEGVALFGGACTIPEGRRQGAQFALLETRLRLAAERGCDIAMMCAAPGSASQRNAERHGFRIAYTRTKWQRPA